MAEMTDAEVFGTPSRGPSAPRLPRGLRNNNPGNIEDGPFARSIPGYQGSDGRFAVYDSMDNGKSAHAALLRSYGGKGINTVEGVVNRWAPPSENDTASYVKFVSQKMGVDPRAPLDMNDPKVLSALAEAQAQRENGAAAMPNAREMSDAEVFGTAKPAPASGQPGAAPMPQRPAPALPGFRPVPATVAPPQVSQGLGFAKGLAHVGDRMAQGLEFAADKVGLAQPINAMNAALGLPSNDQAAASREAFLASQKAKGITPGKIGEFGGSVLGTAWIPGGPLAQGALGGVLTGQATDAKGLAGEAAIGGAVGRLTAGASDALQLGARKVLSKAPQIMNIAGLKKGYQDAYKAVDASGFAFPKAQVEGLVNGLESTMKGRALSKTARGEAGSVINDIRKFVRDNGDVSVSQMEAFRRDIYDALVKKGGDTGALGGAFRGKIDELMDSVPNPDLKRGRELYKRWTTADFVNRASKSADRAAEQTYGGDYGRKVKDRLAPLVDEMKPTRNIRGATPDVIAGIEKVVRGSKTQNLASTLGGMTDVRRMGGKILQGSLGAMTGMGAAGTAGATLLPSLAIQGAVAGGGAGLTATSSAIARKNVSDLIRLIAAGGSKEGLKRVPTRASQSVETAIARYARPALVAGAVPALAAARSDPRTKPKK
ncbi:MAG: hypothetical protein WC718_01395 [Phycisphaerales bacterium]|jgi:hypothetical protein